MLRVLKNVSWGTISKAPGKSTAAPLTPARQIAMSPCLGKAVGERENIGNARRVVIKMGSAVITREDECGLALGRLASIVEQVAELQLQGRQMLLVTSGAVAFGKQKLRQEILMSMSVRQTITTRDATKGFIPPRACAAAGQSGLMSLYEAMFTQYGLRTAQILVTKPDFYNDSSRTNLRSTLNELLRLNIIPIINTNDAVAPPPEPEVDLKGIISIKDNDSLAARVSAEVNADLMILLSDVKGLHTGPPGSDGAKLIHLYSPFSDNNGHQVIFGEKSRVGMGGMESKVKAATWALEHDVSVVIGDGFGDQTIRQIMQGKKVGTFFTMNEPPTASVEIQGASARQGGRALLSLTPHQRADIIRQIVKLVGAKQDTILAENRKDLKEAEINGLAPSLLSRLTLTPAKLRSLCDGLSQIADTSLQNVGRVVKRTLLSDGLIVKQVTVPIGVIMIIFESRPDCLLQIAALAISSANGLLLKGGKEAYYSNRALYDIVREALGSVEDCKSREELMDAISLVGRREDVEDLLGLTDLVDLVIPRGSNELVRTIQKCSKGIPVLGHSDGICHVYVDVDCDPEMAVNIVRDSKCDYPAACNAMETLLLHKDIFGTKLFDDIINMLRANKVEIFAGPRLLAHLKFGPERATSLHKEYSRLACSIELVDDVEGAVNHINQYGSSHTDVIVTSNRSAADHFVRAADSACVFHNASSRFSDGYRFGLGAEVGISTSRIHARGPVGIEGLMTTKWILEGNGDMVVDYAEGGKKKYIFQPLPANDEIASIEGRPGFSVGEQLNLVSVSKNGDDFAKLKVASS